MPWISNHKHTIEEKSTKSSRSSSKFVSSRMARISKLVTTYGIENLVNTVSGDDLVDDTKPLPEPVLTNLNHQWSPVIFTWAQFHWKCSRYQSLEYVANYTFKFITISFKGRRLTYYGVGMLYDVPDLGQHQFLFWSVSSKKKDLHFNYEFACVQWRPFIARFIIANIL